MAKIISSRNASRNYVRVLVPNKKRIREAESIPKKDFIIAIDTLCRAQQLLIGARTLLGQIHDLEDCPEEIKTVIDEFLEDSSGFADPADPEP